MRALAVGVLAVALLATVQAGAQTQAALLDLEWSAPAGCPDHAHVVGRVDALVGKRRPAQHSLVARGRITPTGGASPRYRLELTIGGAGSDARAPRIMTGDDCARLAEAAALVLALDIDPEAGTHVEEPEPAPDQHDPVDPEVPALLTPRTPPLAAPRARRAAPSPSPTPVRTKGSGGARLLFDSGSLPRPTLGAAAAFLLVRGPLALDLQAAWFPSRFTISGPHHGVGGAYVSLATFGAHACWGGVAGEVDWRGCLGGELGREATTGVSIAHPESSASLWSAVSGMIRARVWPERSLSPILGVAAVHPLSAATVQIQGFGTVFEPPAALIRLFLGLETDFF